MAGDNSILGVKVAGVHGMQISPSSALLQLGYGNQIESAKLTHLCCSLEAAEDFIDPRCP